MSDTPKAPAAEKADTTTTTVDLKDRDGQEIGVTVRLKSTKETIEAEDDETPEHLRLRRIVKHVAGWSAMEVDDAPWTFSQERAVALFHRFPWFADQIETGIRKA